MQYNIDKKFLVFKMNAFLLVAVYCTYYFEKTWHQQSIGYQTVLRFQILLTETFSSSMYFSTIKTSDKRALLQNAEVCSERGPAMHSSNHVFWSEQFQKYLS